MNPQILKSFDESIERLEQLCGGKKKRKLSRSDDESFKKSFHKTAKELREVGNEVIMQKAMEAAERGHLTWHEVETLEIGLQHGRRCSPEFLRSIGINVEGRPTRQEALAAMQKALDEGKISFHEFQLGEDALNKRSETPETILKALESRCKEDGEQGDRLEKGEKKEIRVVERQEIPLSIRMSPRLSSEAEILLQNDETEPWVGRMLAKSFRGRFI